MRKRRAVEGEATNVDTAVTGPENSGVEYNEGDSSVAAASEADSTINKSEGRGRESSIQENRSDDEIL
jgi:hypothetical protein